LTIPNQKPTSICPLPFIFDRTEISGIEEFETRISPDWASSSHVIGAGNFEPGKWPLGNYEVDIFIYAKKAATGYFEIY
jgi:hypothetical protein